jgi:uncharacterized protein
MTATAEAPMLALAPAGAAPAPPPAGRITTLDIVRGIAVMGILTMNINGFAMPESAYINPAAWGGASGGDLWAWAGGFVLFEAKMRGLFSVLFGASMALVVGRARAAGENGAAVHYRRMFWLLLFGLAHHYLVWDGDILFQYAVIGAIAYLFVSRSAKVVRRWAIGLLALSCLLHMAAAVGAYGQIASARAPGASAELKRDVAEMLSDFAQPGTESIARQVAVYRSSYRDILADRASPGLDGPLSTLLFFGVETVGLMALGIALLRSGFLTGQWPSARYRAWAVRAYLIGIPPLIALAAWNWWSGFDAYITFSTWFAWAEPFKYAVLIGHAAIIMLFVRALGDSALARRIAAAGRAAFTNYLGTSLIMTTIFYGYGLGLYGHVGRLELYGFVVAMWALMLLWSKPWLERFRYGPFEWLWRSLARFRLEPMRRA